VEPVITHTEWTKGGTEECMTVGDRSAPLRSNRLEVHLTVLSPFLFDEPIEASKAILQFGLQSPEGIRQLFPTAVVDMCAPLRFAETATVRLLLV